MTSTEKAATPGKQTEVRGELDERLGRYLRYYNEQWQRASKGFEALCSPH